jgi:hypothetical protein
MLRWGFSFWKNANEENSRKNARPLNDCCIKQGTYFRYKKMTWAIVSGWKRSVVHVV